MVNLLPTIRLAQLILKRKFPSVDKPLKKGRGLFSEFYGIFFVTNNCLRCMFLTFLDQTSQDQANTLGLDGDDTQGQLLLYPSQISHHLMCSFHCINGQTWITIKEREGQIKVGAKKTIFTACYSNKLKLALTSPHVISTSLKSFLTSRIDFIVLLFFKLLKKHHLPVGQVENRIH